MKIWLDDERHPRDHCGADWQTWKWFKTAEALIAWLERRAAQTGDANLSDFTFSLDHDLGDGRQTGYDLMCWIEDCVANGAQPPESIHLHTQNPVGKERMRAARFKIYALSEVTP